VRSVSLLSMMDALALVACYAGTGVPKVRSAAVRWLERLAAERVLHYALFDLLRLRRRLSQTKHHDLAEKMLLSVSELTFSVTEDLSSGNRLLVVIDPVSCGSPGRG
jgi:hypothetical protein